MTPQELLALYSPFLINWFLVWLTNVAERGKTEPPPANSGRDKEDPAIIVSTHHNHHGNHHHHHRHHHQHQHGDTVADMVWNVSSFLRGVHH